MVAPVIVQICMVIASTVLVVQHILKPRLPVYKLQVGGLPLLTRSSVTGEWKASIATGVELFNANYLNLDVHAISFDLYASGTDDNGREVLRHIGNIQDEQQHQKTATIVEPNDSSLKGKQSWKSRSRRKGERAANVLWSIEARSNFTTSTTMFMSMDLPALLRSFVQLAVRWWQSSGKLTLPTTGAAHIRAIREFSSSTRLLNAPLTVSIICDNLVDTWTMQVTGTECTLYNVMPGWLDLKTAATTVRNYAVSNLAVNATGGVLQHPSPTLEDILSTLAWEESLQLL